MKNYKQNQPARYFPVSEQPFTMTPGLNHLGTDFGNGKQDSLYFQKDTQADIYKQTKETVESDRHWAHFDNENHRELHKKALSWIIKQQKTDCGIESSADHLDAIDSMDDLPRLYNELALNVQEDMALIADNPASLIMGNICMPSFWDPKRIQGASFWDIHQPVPTFPKNKDIGDRLVSLISEKGPYVRFVWTVTNDDRLDHHPENGKTPWDSGQPLWFRTERQVTIPFDGLGALFLIRTYLYPIETLSLNQRKILSLSIESMSEDIARYKGLWDGRDFIIESLKTK